MFYQECLLPSGFAYSLPWFAYMRKQWCVHSLRTFPEWLHGLFFSLLNSSVALVRLQWLMSYSLFICSRLCWVPVLFAALFHTQAPEPCCCGFLCNHWRPDWLVFCFIHIFCICQLTSVPPCSFVLFYRFYNYPINRASKPSLLLSPPQFSYSRGGE